MALPYLLLAVQAAGIGANLYAQRKRAKAEDRAFDLNAMNEDRAIAARMKSLSAQDKSLGLQMEGLGLHS